MTVLNYPSDKFNPEDRLVVVFGGSGLYSIKGLGKHIKTIPAWDVGGYGKPSSDFEIFEIGNTLVGFIARHGLGHIYSPSDIPFRANVVGARMIGAESSFSLSACGTNNPRNMPPGTFVVLDDLLDFTNRIRSFSSVGCVPHVPMNPPFCNCVRSWLLRGLANAGISHYDGGIGTSIEGPQFSTYAWSRMCQHVFGSDIMNMTPATEAALCKELNLPFAVVNLVTDEDNQIFGEGVDTDIVEQTFKSNMENVARFLPVLFSEKRSEKVCSCVCSKRSLATSLHTHSDHISALGKELIALCCK